MYLTRLQFLTNPYKSFLHVLLKSKNPNDLESLFSNYKFLFSSRILI